MITGRELIEKYYSEVEEDERLYSTGDSELDDLLEKAFCEGYEYAQKEFGAKSAALGILAPGAYQGKEAAKYGYDDEEDYKKDRAKYAALGLFTPGTATYVKKKAEQMAKEGKSIKEIRDYLEGKGKYSDKKLARVGLGVAEFATGGVGGITPGVAYGVGAYDKLEDNRKKFKKSKEDKDSKSKKDNKKSSKKK